MRLTTWNVNGIRNPFSYPPWNVDRSFSSMFDILESDIVVMQELKIQRKDLRDDMVLVEGWDSYFSLPKHKKGYSGVGIYTRSATCAPIRAEEGLLGVLPSTSGVPYRDLPEEQQIGGYPTGLQITDLGVDPAALDAEGRCVVVEFPAFVLFGVYSPANSNGLRDDFRYGFICALDCRIRNLIKEGKNVILVGDLNVTRHEMDSGPTLEDIRKSLITREEYISSANRRIFNQLVMGGEVINGRDEGREHGVLWDTTREFHPDRKGMYTHWETKVNARPGNFGSRIDFVLVSDALRPWIHDANIQEGLLGSDHCPVFVSFKDEVSYQGRNVQLLDIMNPPGFFHTGRRESEWQLVSTPAFSAKRMPEFDKRRTIKSMFAAPALRKPRAPPAESLASISCRTETLSSATLPLIHDAQYNQHAAESTDPAPKPETSSKRQAPTAKGQPAKRPKSTTKGAIGKGQQSLKGFFQAKTAPSATIAEETTELAASLSQDTQDGERLSAAARQLPKGKEMNGLDESVSNPPETPRSTQRSVDQSQSPSPRQVASQVASAEQSQKSWGALFVKPVAPTCDHDEPCKSMQTKKKGSNQGRSFWMCARPLGPSGEKERGTEWRCGTFIWCSDWQPRTEATPANSPGKKLPFK